MKPLLLLLLALLFISAAAAQHEAESIHVTHPWSRALPPVSQNGAELYVADEGGPLRIWSLTSATQIDTVATGGSTFGVALTPDGTKLFVGTTAGKILLVNRATRGIIHSINVGGTPRNIAVDPITGYAVVPNEAGGWVDIVK